MPIDFQEDKGIDFVPDEVAPHKLIDPSTVKLSPSELAKMEPGYRPMGIFGPLEPQELLELPKVAQIPGAVLEPLATAAEDMAADWYRRTGIDPSAEAGKSPITMESYPVTAGGPLGLALRQIAPKTAADIDKGAADIIKGFTTPGQQLMLPAAGLSKPLGKLYGLSMIGDVPEAVKQIAEEGAVGIPRLAVDIGGGAGFIHGIPERAAAPIPQRAVVPPPVTGRALKITKGAEPTPLKTYGKEGNISENRQPIGEIIETPVESSGIGASGRESEISGPVVGGSGTQPNQVGHTVPTPVSSGKEISGSKINPIHAEFVKVLQHRHDKYDLRGDRIENAEQFLRQHAADLVDLETKELHPDTVAMYRRMAREELAKQQPIPEPPKGAEPPSVKPPETITKPSGESVVESTALPEIPTQTVQDIKDAALSKTWNLGYAIVMPEAEAQFYFPNKEKAAQVLGNITDKEQINTLGDLMSDVADSVGKELSTGQKGFKAFYRKPPIGESAASTSLDIKNPLLVREPYGYGFDEADLMGIVREALQKGHDGVILISESALPKDVLKQLDKIYEHPRYSFSDKLEAEKESLIIGNLKKVDWQNGENVIIAFDRGVEKSAPEFKQMTSDEALDLYRSGKISKQQLEELIGEKPPEPAKPPPVVQGKAEPSPVPPAAPTSEVTAKEAAPTVPEPAISKTTPVGEKVQEGITPAVEFQQVNERLSEIDAQLKDFRKGFVTGATRKSMEGPLKNEQTRLLVRKQLLEKEIAPHTPPPAPMKEAWEMTRSEFEKEFNDLTSKVEKSEKTPQRRMSPEEVALMKKDWKEYSKSRGYSEQEIADFERLQNLSLPLSDLIPKGEEIPLVSPENIHATFVARAIREGKKVPKNVLNEYPELAKGEQATQGKVQSAATRFRPKEQVVFDKPLVGPSGAKLVAYEWRWQPEEFVDKYGEEKTRRVSNWEEAESSGDTGRDIVHQFLVEMPNGDKRLVSAESVPVLLGFAERGKGSRLPSLVSATKTLAQLRMKLATVKAQLEEYNKAVEASKKLPLPEITSEPAIAAVGRDKGKRWGTTWKMGDAYVMQHDELPISPERKATLESFWRANRVSETGAKQPYASVRDLQNRIERQQRKIKDITETAAVVVPSPTPIPEGPGAATVGDVPKAPQIVQLTEEFKRIEGKPVSFRDKLREWFNIAEHKSLAQGAFQRSLDALKSTRDYLINKWDGVKDFDDIKRVKGELSAEINSRGWTLRQFENQTRKSIPRKADREAISSWLDNGGDEAKIRKAMAEAPERYKKSYEDALNLSPELKLAAEHIRSFFEARLQEAIDAGVLEEGITDYIHRIYKRDTPVKQRILNQVQSGVLNTKTPGLAMKRAFEFDYEAEKAGYPIVKDFLPRIVDYEYSLARVIADRAAVKKFMDIRMSDGRPMIDVAGVGIPVETPEGVPEATLIKPQVKPGDPTNPGAKGYRKDYLERNDYPAFRKWKWATKDPETGRSIFVQGDVLVHPEAAERIDALMAKSAIRRTKLGSAALGLSSTFKQTMLDFSGFHQVQIAVHGLEHRVTPWNLIKDIDVTNPKVQGLLKGGLNIGGDFHAFDYREGLVGRSLSRMIPGLGELMQSYHEYLFRDYIPRVKTTMALHALERNRQRFPKMTEEQLNYLTAKQANAAFGELNYILMERSKTAQDISRLILLAPDFLEARGSFAAQALQRAGLKDLRPDKFLSGNEQRQALLLGALTLYVTARIANKLIDDQYHFEPENAFSIVHGGHSYSLRTVQGDLLHLWDKPFQFWLNRLNPVFGRTFLELGTGRDYFGRKRSRMELAWDLLANIRPIAFRDSQERKLWESALNAFGVQAKRWTDVDDAFTLAKKWKDEHGIGERGEFIYDAEKDPLRQLKLALNHGDEAEAAKQIGQIIKPGSYYTKDKLKNYFDRYASMPFTGSFANDKKWKATLSEDQLKTVESAKEHKRQIRQLFLKSYSQYNAALAAQPYATRTGKQ